MKFLFGNNDWVKFVENYLVLKLSLLLIFDELIELLVIFFGKFYGYFKKVFIELISVISKVIFCWNCFLFYEMSKSE